MYKSATNAKALPVMIFLSATFPYVGPLELGTQPVFPVMLMIYAIANLTSRIVLGVLAGSVFAIFQIFMFSWAGYPVFLVYVLMALLISLFAFSYKPLATKVINEKGSIVIAVKISRAIIIMLLVIGLISQDLMVSVNEIFISEIRGTHLNTMWFFSMEPGHGAFTIFSFFILSYITSPKRIIILDMVISVVCLALIKTLTALILLLFLLNLIYLKRKLLMEGIGRQGKLFTVFFVLLAVGGGVAVGTSSGITNARINQLLNYEEMEGASPAIRIMQLRLTVEKIANLDFYEHVGGAPAVGIYSYVDRFPLVTGLFVLLMLWGMPLALKIMAFAYMIMLPVLTPFLFIFVMFAVLYKSNSGLSERYTNGPVYLSTNSQFVDLSGSTP